MIRPSVYLAGALTGLSYEDAKGWRDFFEILVHPVHCLSPLDGMSEAISGSHLGDNFKTGDQHHFLFRPEVALARDLYDIDRADFVVANLGLGDTVSIGTVMEIAYAYAKKKTIIVITGKPQYNHLFVREMTTIEVPDVLAAAEVVNGFVRNETALEDAALLRARRTLPCH